MFRTDPQHLCASLTAIRDQSQLNQVSVPADQRRWARLSLERMLNLA
jgi:quinolinate synthase